MTTYGNFAVEAAVLEVTLEETDECALLFEDVLELEVVLDELAGNTILRGGTFGELASAEAIFELPFEGFKFESLSASEVSMPFLRILSLMKQLMTSRTLTLLVTSIAVLLLLFVRV